MIKEVKMQKLKLIIIIVLSLSLTIIKGYSETANEEAFSFSELQNAAKVEIPELQFIPASDEVNLAYHEYIPEQIDAVLIFYHGGGAYSEAGYQHIGSGLSKDHDILVVTPDLRGHGFSEGATGDSPSINQVYEDVSVFIQLMKKKYPTKKLFLGGHSSGAGLVLNYSTWKYREEVDGYVFLSPQLGFRSNTQNKDNNFATVKQEVFVKNSMSGTDGNTPAVFFNYPIKVLESTKNISSITVNMSEAITPTAPAKQIKKLDKPAAVWIGKDDEIFHADKVMKLFQKKNPEVYAEMIEGEKHLSILVNATEYLGVWLQNEKKK